MATTRPERLYFTGNDEADELIAREPLALLIGFVLDQQVTVQKAFSGPLELRERLGAIDAATLASADLEPVFRAKPALHRFPGAMAFASPCTSPNMFGVPGFDAKSSISLFRRNPSPGTVMPLP